MDCPRGARKDAELPLPLVGPHVDDAVRIAAYVGRVGVIDAPFEPVEVERGGAEGVAGVDAG